MLRRLRHASRKADSGDGTTIHKGHDDQSETDSQNQSSEEIKTASKVLSSKRKALVCTDTKTANGHRVNSFASSYRTDATSIQRLASCFHSASYVTIIL